jgi:hypothetical protein
MYAANRSLKPDDVTTAFERYKKLSQQTARNIVSFYERRMRLQAQTNAKGKKSSGRQVKVIAEENEPVDDILVMPSPSLAPT